LTFCPRKNNTNQLVCSQDFFPLSRAARLTASVAIADLAFEGSRKSVPGRINIASATVKKYSDFLNYLVDPSQEGAISDSFDVLWFLSMFIFMNLPLPCLTTLHRGMHTPTL
jgi:hypothetical protein